MENYKEINRNAWNKKTDVHIHSDFYDNETFLSGKSSLKNIELDLLGDIQGKSVLHLQCHFGQDSISLARMGAKVTAIDLSDNAIEKAKSFTKQTNTDVEFICCNIFDLPQKLNKQFDIVFTSYGVIGWLPDMDKWANVVSHFLKPNGRFIFVEFHPFLWIFDDNFQKIAYNYFNSGEIVECFDGSYANRQAPISYQTVNWNHSLSNIINSLINQSIEIKSFDEFDYSPYNCFNNMIKIEEDKYRIKDLEYAIPMLYSIEGIKK